MKQAMQARSMLARCARWGLLALAATAAGLGGTGCLISSSNDVHPHDGVGGAAGGQGRFSVSWSVVDGNQTTTTCAAVGAPSMDMDVQNLDTNKVIHDTFPCAPMSGLGSEAPAGRYTVALRLRSAGGEVESEATGPTVYTIVAGGVTDLGSVPMEVAQSFLFSWTLDKRATGAPLSCAQAAAETVRLTVDGNSFEWPCDAGQARSPALSPGDHTVTVEVLDAQGLVLSATDAATIQIAAGKDTTPTSIGFAIE